MANNCKLVSNYDPASWDLKGLKVGATYPAENTFSGAGVDISSDTFRMEVSNENGNPVKTLTIGDGVTIVSPTEVVFLIGAPITDAAGTYTHVTWRTEAATGASYPYFEGRIIVNP